ncbi:heme ABC transporter ATP-binding protein [Paenibacillus sp. J2TS4]|uniref:heme ABC transporter ATP-binding protein n=1 Tax=Paenibacillus sp. J2TS4 TaxID=2807194 RepID=UPI001B17B87B|nr:heme ABC transporter ATP-binding protein [Paenibacillus sp. J2TS4]GIP31532.1 hypothetical protein J2TS4_07420 [Paenibacillus sp. J2TS4]
MTVRLNAHDLAARIDRISILRHVNLSVFQGEFVGLIGPNGSGKSTLLRVLAGFLKPSAGEVSLDGAALQTMPRKAIARKLAFVPQDLTVDFDFTVREIVAMGRHPFLSRFGVESGRDRDQTEEAMRQTGILHLGERSMPSLSGGQRQMAFIAKALAQEPEVLLLDEPISALDIGHQLRVLGVIRRLCGQGLSAIAALHDLNLASRYCDRLILIREGEVLASGTSEEVMTETFIRQAYGVDAVVTTDSTTGKPAVTALQEAAG